MKSIRSLMMAAALVVGWGPGMGMAGAAEPARELEDEAAIRLIALKNETRETGIAIATIVEGSKDDSGKFEARHVRRVTAIHPVTTEGGRVRQIRCYDFHWSERFGWFMWEKRQARGGEEVWVWSETEGEVVVK